MNNLVTNFPQILDFAQSYGLPLEKKRAIIREYLQSKFITRLYAQSQSQHLSLVGGTGLRLLHNLPRFSEDLDFDNLGLTKTEIIRLIKHIQSEFTRENIQVQLKSKIKDNLAYHEFRFPNLLFDLSLTTNPREKLMIKIDHTSNWTNQTPQVLLFNKYGFIEQIVTNPLSQIMVQKLAAYVHRLQTQPRDMYDLVWLYAQGAQPDFRFIKANKLADLINTAKIKFAHEGVTPAMLRRLRPFLFDESDVNKLKLLGEILTKLTP